MDRAGWRSLRGDAPEILTPDDIMSGRLPSGPTVVHDEGGHYLGGVIAGRVTAAGVPVTLCTPSDSVSHWAGMTSERWRVRSHLMRLGIGIELAHSLAAFDGDTATLNCGYSGAAKGLAVASVVMVTQRMPKDSLHHDILSRGAEIAQSCCSR